MKRNIFLLVMVSVFSMVSMVTAQTSHLNDGQRVMAHFNRTRAVCGMQGEIISPYILTQIVKSESAATHYAIVSINGDTLRIRYYNNKSEQLEKVETYTNASAYMESNANLIMDGTQSYYIGGRLMCEEIMKENELQRTLWYNADGTSDRTYIFKNNRLVQQMQHYPSGKLKWMEVYLANGSIQRQVFTEDAQPAELIEPTYPGGIEAFEEYFSKNFKTEGQGLKNGVYTVCLHVNTDGNSEMIVWNSLNTKNGFFHENFNRPQYFSMSTAPKWTPATINGGPVSFTSVLKLNYDPRPLKYIKDGDSLNIARKSSYQVQRNGIQWRDYQLWLPSANDTCPTYAIFHKHNDTLTLDCYNQTDHQLFAQHGFIYSPDEEQETSSTKNNFSSEGHFTGMKEALGGFKPLFYKKYVDGKLYYYEHCVIKKDFTLAFDTLQWYYPNGQVKYHFSPDEEHIARYSKLTEYYPTGEIKVVEVPVKDSNKNTITYYNKQGQTAKPIMPTLTEKIAKMEQYIAENVNITDYKYYNLHWQNINGQAEIFYEVDENGEATLTNVQIVTFDMAGISSGILFYYSNDFEPLIRNCLSQYNTSWAPGKINGEPVTLRTTIKVRFSFSK